MYILAFFLLMSTNTLDSYQQLHAIKANDDKTLQQLYKDNYTNVERFVLQNNGSSDEAKDIYQEAFIAFWRNIQLEKFVPENAGSINAYLFKIAKFKWMDHLRSATYKKTTSLEDKHENVMTFEEYNDNDQQHINSIKEKFKQLGDNCRDILTRFYYRKQP